MMIVDNSFHCCEKDGGGVTFLITGMILNPLSFDTLRYAPWAVGHGENKAIINNLHDRVNAKGHSKDLCH